MCKAKEMEEEENRRSHFSFKNKKLVYVAVFSGILIFLFIFIIALVGDTNHPALVALYTLMGVLLFFVCLFLIELWRHSRGNSITGNKKSVNISTIEDSGMGRSEIPYGVDDDMPDTPGDAPPDYFEATRHSSTSSSSSNSTNEGGDGGMTFSVDLTSSAN